MYAVLLPILVFLVVYFRRRDVYDLHHAVLGDKLWLHIVLLVIIFHVHKKAEEMVYVKKNW